MGAFIQSSKYLLIPYYEFSDGCCYGRGYWINSRNFSTCPCPSPSSCSSTVCLPSSLWAPITIWRFRWGYGSYDSVTAWRSLGGSSSSTDSLLPLLLLGGGGLGGKGGLGGLGGAHGGINPLMLSLLSCKEPATPCQKPNEGSNLCGKGLLYLAVSVLAIHFLDFNSVRW